MEIYNREAKFNYFILEEYECGIVLKGTELKSIRLGRANIKDSYATIRNNEIYLLNMHISAYKEGNIFNHEERRTRKLLMHKREIVKINNQVMQEGLTLIPLKVYFKKNKVNYFINNTNTSDEKNDKNNFINLNYYLFLLVINIIYKKQLFFYII